jgi:hypothetical protein
VEQARADRRQGQAWCADEQRGGTSSGACGGSARAAHGTGRAKKRPRPSSRRTTCEVCVNPDGEASAIMSLALLAIVQG